MAESEVNIYFGESDLRLSHFMGASSNELSAKFDAENPRWRAAATQMLRRVGVDASEWKFSTAQTQVLNDGRKAVQYVYHRRPANGNGNGNGNGSHGLGNGSGS